jgi:hypothetical protein
MAITNHERVGRALDLLNTGLRPFAEREMQSVHGEKWIEAARSAIREDRSSPKQKGTSFNAFNKANDHAEFEFVAIRRMDAPPVDQRRLGKRRQHE